ncbi:hypothetical protein HK104_008248 [Borealophlyctis nickersoniae]|nr:hypothetical protein HK104_008248 [Borealophlyctis nickersoniae]
MKVLFLILSTITSLVAAAGNDIAVPQCLTNQTIKANTGAAGGAPDAGGYTWVPFGKWKTQKRRIGSGVPGGDICLTRVYGNWTLGVFSSTSVYGNCLTQSGDRVFYVDPAIANVWMLELDEGRNATWVHWTDVIPPHKYYGENYVQGPELQVSVCEVCDETSCTIGYRDVVANRDGCKYPILTTGTAGTVGTELGANPSTGKSVKMLVIGGKATGGVTTFSPVPPTRVTTTTSTVQPPRMTTTTSTIPSPGGVATSSTLQPSGGAANPSPTQ